VGASGTGSALYINVDLKWLLPIINTKIFAMGSHAGDLLRFYKSILDLYDFAAVFMIFMCDSLNSVLS
jgi:hypothetical protein